MPSFTIFKTQINQAAVSGSSTSAVASISSFQHPLAPNDSGLLSQVFYHVEDSSLVLLFGS